MRLLPSLRRLFGVRRLDESPGLPENVRKVDDFRAILEYERMRVDRNGGRFCLLFFQAAEAARPLRDKALQDHALRDHAPRDVALRDVACCLADRLRTTDVCGRLEDARLAVLLPDTSLDGALKVLADLRAMHPRRLIDVACEVDVYPPERSAAGRSPADDDRASPVVRRPHPDGASGENDGERAMSDKTSDETRDDATSRAAGTQSGSSMTSLFVRRTPAAKACIDFGGALLGLVVLSPVFLTAAALVRLSSPGPVFFRQRREGRGGREFTIYKFRTMRTGAEALQSQLRHLNAQDGPAFKLERDPRVTSVGRLLRKTCIDELPQLWNVLRGDMSFVGPRPLPCEESRQCDAWQRRRLDVKPGLTCVWQARDEKFVPFAEWMRMDLRYVRFQSLLFDMTLILKTVRKVFLLRASH